MNSQEEFYFTLWQKHYLQLEVEQLETTLKHYVSSGWVTNEDYQFLHANLKMLKAFLNTHIQETNKSNPHKHQKNWNHYPKLQGRHKRKIRNDNPKQLTLFDLQKPISITGKIEVEGLTESLRELKPKEPEKSGPKFPYKIPSGTQWNQVIIKFLDNERVEIYVKKQKHTTDFKEMGFVGKGKIPEPSEQWTFLKVLAQCNGEITINDESSKDTYKQQKHLLTESLKNYFSIDYDPFYPYKSSPEKQGNSYRIKLTLIPPSKSLRPSVIEPVDEDVLGIKEYLDEQAPSIIDH